MFWSYSIVLFNALNRLVMYIERDSRKQSTGKLENHMQFDYLSKCLEWLVSTLVELVPAILSKYQGSKNV